MLNSGAPICTSGTGAGGFDNTQGGDASQLLLGMAPTNVRIACAWSRVLGSLMSSPIGFVSRKAAFRPAGSDYSFVFPGLSSMDLYSFRVRLVELQVRRRRQGNCRKIQREYKPLVEPCDDLVIGRSPVPCMNVLQDQLTCLPTGPNGRQIIVMVYSCRKAVRADDEPWLAVGWRNVKYKR